LEIRICHDFERDFANGYRGFGDFGGDGGLDKIMAWRSLMSGEWGDELGGPDAKFRSSGVS
jgi:hypothetical protein